METCAGGSFHARASSKMKDLAVKIVLRIASAGADHGRAREFLAEYFHELVALCRFDRPQRIIEEHPSGGMQQHAGEAERLLLVEREISVPGCMSGELVGKVLEPDPFQGARKASSLKSLDGAG